MKKKTGNNLKLTSKHIKKRITINPETIDNLFIEPDKQNKSPNKTSKTKDTNENIINNANSAKRKESDIDMFTEGRSFEEIDKNKYIKTLIGVNNLFKNDILNKNAKKKVEDKKEKFIQKINTYLCERSLYQEIDMNLKIKNNEKINNIINKLCEYFDDNFIYYEYSNNKQLSINKISEGDLLTYRNLFRKMEDNSSKEENIKQLDYINTMNDLYRKYNKEQKLFYIITTLIAYSFNYNKKYPLIFTDSKVLEKQLEQREIKANKIKNNLSKKKRKNSLDNSKNSNSRKASADNNKRKNSLRKKSVDSDEDEEDLDELINDSPLGVDELYVGNIFNFFINNYSKRAFNVFSNFQFEGGAFRKCKRQIVKVDNKNENNVINIKVEGVIFDEQLKNLTEYLKNELKDFSYSVKLNKVKNTKNFYKENEDIENEYNRFEFKNNEFYYYKQ